MLQIEYGPKSYYLSITYLLIPMSFIRSFSILIAALCTISAQEPATDPTPVPDTPENTEDHVRVAVGCEQVGSATRKVEEMGIRTSKFRNQMQAIQDLKMNVLSLEDFVLWKQGKKTIPDKSVLITIDDGWLSVYTDAYPILKEFEYPFTIYLYTNYIDRGGRSMTSEMIKEMMAMRQAQKRIQVIWITTFLMIAVPISAFWVGWLIYWMFR